MCRVPFKQTDRHIQQVGESYSTCSYRLFDQLIDIVRDVHIRLETVATGRSVICVLLQYSSADADAAAAAADAVVVCLFVQSSMSARMGSMGYPLLSAFSSSRFTSLIFSIAGSNNSPSNVE